MSENKHTPEPWAIDPDDRPNMHWNNHIVSEANPNIAICFMAHDGTEQNERGEANARRIVACVNACAGISQQYLEELNGETLADKQMVLITQRDEYSLLAYRRKNILDEVIKQRDEMLVALEDLIDLYDGRKHEGIAIVANARATIASVKGGAA